MDYYFDQWDPYDPLADLDEPEPDLMRDTDEPNKLGRNGLPYDPDLADTDGDECRDDEDWACKAEDTWVLHSFDDVDWANPGHQSNQ